MMFLGIFIYALVKFDISKFSKFYIVIIQFNVEIAEIKFFSNFYWKFYSISSKMYLKYFNYLTLKECEWIYTLKKVPFLYLNSNRLKHWKFISVYKVCKDCPIKLNHFQAVICNLLFVILSNIVFTAKIYRYLL